MNALKKTIFVGGATLLLQGGISVFANYVPVVPTSGLPGVGDCTLSRTNNMYLSQDNDTDQKKDYRAYLRDNFIEDVPGNSHDYDAAQLYQVGDVNTSTKLLYYAPEANMLSKKNPTDSGFVGFTNSTFQCLSRVFPYNTRVRGIDSTDTKILFEQPVQNMQDKTVNVRYYYNYKTAEDRGRGTSPYYYYPVSNSGNFSQMLASSVVLRTGVTRTRSSLKQFVSCQTFDLHRCGDGTTDSYTLIGNRANHFTGEICDDGALNGTAGHCDVNCGVGGGPVCGNAIIEEGEDCDDGAGINGTDMSACLIDCMEGVLDQAVDQAVDE